MGTWITVIWNHKNGQTFFPMFEKRAGAWFAWIFMLTNPEEAGKHLRTFYTSLCFGVAGVKVFLVILTDRIAGAGGLTFGR